MEFIREVWPDADSAALVAAQEAFARDYVDRAIDTMEREGLIPDSLRDVPRDSLDFWSVHRDRELTRVWRIQFTAVNTCNPDRSREMEGGMIYYSQNVANQLMNDPSYGELAEEFWPALGAFDGPVRVVIGTCDYVDLGPGLWPRIVERLPDGAITVVEESGHAIWMDDPDGFEAAALRALAEIGGGGGE